MGEYVTEMSLEGVCGVERVLLRIVGSLGNDNEDTEDDAK